jgi:hypothetical protein
MTWLQVLDSHHVHVPNLKRLHNCIDSAPTHAVLCRILQAEALLLPQLG